MTIFKLIKIASIIMLELIIMFDLGASKQPGPIIDYYLYPDTYIGEIHKIDWSSGNIEIADSIDFSKSNYTISRGIENVVYDPVNGRIFFQESLTRSPIFTRVYELATRRLFDLPFANYSGGGADMVISPGSAFIIIHFRFMPHDSLGWSENQYKTVVLNGITLELISQKVGFILSCGRSNYWPIVTNDNKVLFNIDANIDEKADAIIPCSLPDLTPEDTLLIYDLGWKGDKKLFDAVDYNLLLQGTKIDNSLNISPGSYAFLIDGHTGQLASKFINVDASGEAFYKLSPAGDEILALSPDRGIIQRYSVSTGVMLGKIQVGTSFNFPVFRDDGNLYLKTGDGSHNQIAVDYRNNRVARTFQLQEVTR